MKKTNIRAHRNGGSKAVSPQVPNQPEPVKGKAQTQRYQGKVNIDTWDPQGVALVVMTGSVAGPEEEIAGLNYSAAELEGIKAIAGDSATGLAAFLHSAIEQRLNHGTRVSELEEAIEQAAALYNLIEHKVFNPDDGGKMAEHIKCGVVDLASATFNRLHSAAEALRTLATVKGGVQ